MNIEEVLSRLRKVRKTGKSSWVACCPSHEDRSPSLSISHKDGTTLLNCFGGCSVQEVAGAIGLQLSDLFPPRESSSKPFQKNRLNPYDVVRRLKDDLVIVGVAARMLANGEQLAESDILKLFEIHQRSEDAARLIGVAS